jgi:hypothetical protein
MRARNIKPSLFTNEDLGTMDPMANLLFIGLWCLADRDGRLEDRPLRIKAELFPYRDNVDCNGYLTVLERSGFIQRYSVDGSRYIQVVNFTKHQTPHHTERSKNLPPPANENTGENVLTVTSPLRNGEHTVPTRSDSLIPDSLIPDSLIPDSLIPDSLIPDSLIQSASGGRCEYSEDFETFWNAFPRQRRSKKGEAYRRWKTAVRSVPATVLISAVEEYAQSEVGRSEFAVMPAVWLNGRMWEDDREAWVRKTNGKPSSNPQTFQQIKGENTRKVISNVIGEIFGETEPATSVEGN